MQPVRNSQGSDLSLFLFFVWVALAAADHDPAFDVLMILSGTILKLFVAGISTLSWYSLSKDHVSPHSYNMTLATHTQLTVILAITPGPSLRGVFPGYHLTPCKYALHFLSSTMPSCIWPFWKMSISSCPRSKHLRKQIRPVYTQVIFITTYCSNSFSVICTFSQ